MGRPVVGLREREEEELGAGLARHHAGAEMTPIEVRRIKIDVK
jgi:hypothetical protein